MSIKSIMILILLFSSCDDNGIDALHRSNGLIGEWKWLESCGGFAGQCHTPESTGDTKTIEFTADSTYRMILNDSLILESPFHIQKSKSIYSEDSTEVIIYDKHSIRQSFSINNDSLILNDEVYDGFQNFYKRIK